jgi:hypothetical protein
MNFGVCGRAWALNGANRVVISPVARNTLCVIKKLVINYAGQRYLLRGHDFPLRRQPGSKPTCPKLSEWKV